MYNSFSKEATGSREERRLRAWELKQEGRGLSSGSRSPRREQGSGKLVDEADMRGRGGGGRVPTSFWSATVPERGATRRSA